MGQDKTIPLEWAEKFRQLSRQKIPPEMVIVRFLQYCTQKEHEVWKRMQEKK